MGNNEVWVLDTAGALITKVGMFGQPRHIAVNSSGSRAYVTNQISRSLAAIDTATYSTETVSVGADPEGVAVSPTDARVYVTNFSGDSVSIVDAGALSVVDTPSVGDGPRGIAVNSSETRAYAALQRDHQVVALRLSDGAGSVPGRLNRDRGAWHCCRTALACM
jgi:YVTN family beta-propeller protein